MAELEREGQEPEPIYVVGFPKSGNTWLTKVLADVLQAPVCPTDIRGRGLEIASEVNRHLYPQVRPLFELFKVHFLPDVVLREVAKLPKRMVYIYRDFRDVTISAFFYRHSFAETDVRITNCVALLPRPRASVRHWRGRRKLLEYVEKLTVDGWGPDVGTWCQHIEEWRDVSVRRTDMRSVSISYEELSLDTSSTLLRVVDELGLPRPSDGDMQNAVGRHSFRAEKEYFRKLQDGGDIPLGRDFNLRFLRKGVVGDWKSFLSPRMCQIIQQHHGEMLFELRYESNPHWYRKP